MSDNKNIKLRPGVIVIGGHVQGLGITRIFGKNNIPVVLLDETATNLTRHSKYCKEFIKYSKNKMLDKLLSLIEEKKYENWLLMPTNDRHVGILGDNKNELARHFKVSTANKEALKHLFNKRNTYKLATDLNIPIPNTWSPDTWEDVIKLDLVYPCIIKPAVMHTFYSQIKKKVFVCNNIAELEENYNRALSLIPNDEVIIQDIVPGNSEHQYSVCFMFDGEKPLVTLSARRARQHPPDFGNATTYAETVSIPEIVTYAETILKEINFIGVCEVEFKYDTRDNTYKFLEVNPRTWKWHSIAEKSDSPILMSLYHFMYELEPIVKNNQEEATFRHLITDLPTMIKMKLSKINYAKTKTNTKYAVWDSKDIVPAIFEILYLPYFILKR